MASKFIIDYISIDFINRRGLLENICVPNKKSLFFEGSAIQMGARAGAFKLVPVKHCRKKHHGWPFLFTLAPFELAKPGDGLNFRRKSVESILRERFARKLDVGEYSLRLHGYDATLDCSFGSSGNMHDLLYLLHNIFYSKYGYEFPHFCDNYNGMPYYEFRRLPWDRSKSQRTCKIIHCNERIKMYLRTFSGAKNIVRFEVSRKQGSGDLGKIYPEFFDCECRSHGRGGRIIRLNGSREKLSDAIVDHIEQESGKWIVRFQDILDELGIMRETDRYYPGI